MSAPRLDLSVDVVELTAALCDIESVSGDEERLAGAVEDALQECAHLEVVRDGNTVIARTDLGRDERVVLAGHLDTVPLTAEPNLPTRMVAGPDGPELWGRGTVDMKGGVAVQLKLAHDLTEPVRDITFIFYDCEEVDADRNSLTRLARTRPEIFEGDFAVLLEPTRSLVEGGCKGTLRAEVRTRGVTAHSGRQWMGENAIHAAAPVLTRLAEYEPREVDVDGLLYREGLSAVGISGGIAGNVIPDECTVSVNYRFAPDIDLDAAIEHVREVFDGFEVEITDGAGGARPGLDRPAAQAFVEAIGGEVTAKQGWTDVSRFSGMGVPAVNFGPGDPLLAHKDDEQCPVGQLQDAEKALRRWLS
ncbi:MAG: succinyl-diaminopimelate desuccinylase [Mobilicoccus sp.]|nr:succinyl-diaminopimelate desuccinylase [Mobilicoccus sp.]